MKILFDIGHPAQFHLFKNTINTLELNAHKIAVLTKTKDILDNLLQEAGIKYVNILHKRRGSSKLGLAIGVLKRNYQLFIFARKFRPELMIGTSMYISYIGKMLNIPTIHVNEDDAKIVPLYSKTAYPWASVILSPVSCNNDKWENKSIKHKSFHELAYLHPNQFNPNRIIAGKYIDINKPFFIIRFAKLDAYHDEGIKGIDICIAKKLIEILNPFGTVYITSERELESELESYRIKINPIDIHHVMAFANIYIGDSQTMAAEAGVLGIPFIRFNDFVGRIGYLNELEEKYVLGYGIRPNNPELLFQKVEELLQMKNRQMVFQDRRKKMLEDKIDFAKFLTWFIEGYPQSMDIMKNNPDYQDRFK